MANTDKNIVITPNIGSASDPQIVFSGANANVAAQNITLKIYPENSGTLSLEGSAGQLFSVTNNLTGSIFTVNDISGIPSIEVLDTGVIKFAQYSGNILIGTGTDGGQKLQVNGVTKTLGFQTNVVSKTSGYTATSSDLLILVDATSTALTITLPTAVNCAGQMFTVKKIDSSANAVTVATTSSQTIDGATTRSLASQWNNITVQSNGANWFIVSSVSAGGAGTSGFSGYSGVGGPGTSGFSGYSGLGFSGFSGYSGTGGSGYSGVSGWSGNAGITADSVYVYLSAATNTTNAGWQKVPVDTTRFDTNSIYDSVNKRIVPKKEGYYIVHGRARTNSAIIGAVGISKNGTLNTIVGSDTGAGVIAHGASTTIYCNGTTDYLELRLYSTVVGAITNADGDTYLQVTGPINTGQSGFSGVSGGIGLSGVSGFSGYSGLRGEGGVYLFYDSNTTNTLDYNNGAYQRWAPSGTVTLAISNWPAAGTFSELVIEGVNLGAATITWPTINWIKSDGTMTTTFGDLGITLQSSGTDFVVLWTRDGGTTVYGKFVR